MSLGDRIFETIDLTFSIKPNPMELVSIGEVEERDAKQIYLCQTNVEWHMHKGKYVFAPLTSRIRDTVRCCRLYGLSADDGKVSSEAAFARRSGS